MKKLKLDDWNAGCKTWENKTVSEEITLKTSNSMMARLLVITWSSRDMDLIEIIGKYEFSNINRMLMTPDSKLHPCEDKSQLLHILQALVPDVPNFTANIQLIAKFQITPCCLWMEWLWWTNWSYLKQPWRIARIWEIILFVQLQIKVMNILVCMSFLTITMLNPPWKMQLDSVALKASHQQRLITKLMIPQKLMTSTNFLAVQRQKIFWPCNLPSRWFKIVSFQ